MPSKAWNAFNENAEDVRRLLEIHSSLGGAARGRRYRLEVLNKSALVLITAIWEAYCEDIAAEALAHIVSNVRRGSQLPTELKKKMASELKAAKNDIAVWGLADSGWKNLVQARLAELTADRNRKLNTPKSASIDDLFAIAIGLQSVSSGWRWKGMSAERARKKLDGYVALRGAVAHRGKSGASCKKAQVEDYFRHVRRIASRTGGRVNGFVQGITGKRLW